jgi:hypothetical protein
LAGCAETFVDVDVAVAAHHYSAQTLVAEWHPRCFKVKVAHAVEKAHHTAASVRVWRNIIPVVRVCAGCAVYTRGAFALIDIDITIADPAMAV